MARFAASAQARWFGRSGELELGRAARRPAQDGMLRPWKRCDDGRRDFLEQERIAWITGIGMWW
jgi:hypothetical protein